MTTSRAAMLTLWLVAACAGARPPESVIEVTRFRDTLVYFGPLTPAGLARLKGTDDGTARALLVQSGGGEVSIAMDFGEWVHARQLDVIVVDHCASSCANYVFPAGKAKWILPGGVVAWHGSPLDPTALAEIEGLPTEERRARSEYLTMVREKQKRFFERVGVNECLTRFGRRLGARGFFAMSVEDMRRFGVTNVVVGPRSEDDIEPSARSSLRLTFVRVPPSADLQSCD